jgi:anti-sigma-K factor RskA
MNTLRDDKCQDTELDDVARALHAEALAQLPSRTLAQLRTRRSRVRPAAVRRTPALGWGLAATAAVAVLAVAFGLRMDPSAPDLPGDRHVAGLPGAAVEATEASYRQTYAALDEDPDFYLWLATTDVQPLAME